MSLAKRQIFVTWRTKCSNSASKYVHIAKDGRLAVACFEDMAYL